MNPPSLRWAPQHGKLAKLSLTQWVRGPVKHDTGGAHLAQQHGKLAYAWTGDSLPGFPMRWRRSLPYHLALSMFYQGDMQGKLVMMPKMWLDRDLCAKSLISTSLYLEKVNKIK